MSARDARARLITASHDRDRTSRERDALDALDALDSAAFEIPADGSLHFDQDWDDVKVHAAIDKILGRER